MAPILIWSAALLKKAAKVEANVTARFLHAAPIATPARFCSAIKHSDERSGKASKNLRENVEFLVSPSKAQTRSLASPSFFKAVPYAALVAILSDI
jgi:hypothetical protein